MANSYKIATWNVNSIRVRMPHILQWLETAQPDVLAIQETKTVDDNFPLEAIEGVGYQATYFGQKSYNGVAILSRTPAEDVISDVPNLADPQRRILGATIGDIRILNLYVPNGATVDSDKYIYKLDWLDKVTAFVKKEMKKYPNYLILGDFNIAPEDRDVYDPKKWEGQVLVSAPEREAFQQLLSEGFTDTFRLFEEGEIFSWWNYRTAAFRGDRGLRIDHILTSQALTDRCIGCAIDKDPRGWERPSDHAPVIAQFNL